jgi:glycosyltransferase involved in cell wall biosynthesis
MSDASAPDQGNRAASVTTALDTRDHVLVIGNNGTPTDRRVWLECTALHEAGFAVSVISPGTPDVPMRERIDGIDVYRYRTPTRAGSPMRFVLSFASSWLSTLRLACSIWRRRRFAIVQACNPPDTYFTIAALFRPFGVRFLFDQHDLSAEIYRDRFERPSARTHTLLLALERWTHRVADHVITVNESCKDLLIARTSTTPAHLTVVRTGPDVERLRLVAPQPDLKRGRRFLCAYLGVMGPQDDVDLVLRAVHELVHELGRDDIQFILMGDGQCLSELKALARDLAIEPWVDFTGWADDATISAVLSNSDLGLQPDRRTPFTDLCTMLKTVEYLAFGLPVVAFDLTESRRTAGEAALFVEDETAVSYARAIVSLLDDPERCAEMSAHALWLARTVLAWDGQKNAYVEVVRGLIGRRRCRRRSMTRMRTGPTTWHTAIRRARPGLVRNVEEDLA